MTLAAQLTGHTTVQASAGSGKTYLLISRIVRLLLTGEDAGSVLAITFTNKAANEMQTRLLQRLYELATCDETQLIKILQSLQLEVTPALITLSRHLYEDILRSDAPVKTSTFHAFCQELLRRFPMEANISPGFDLLDKTVILYDEAWDALMANANANKNAALGSSLHFLFKELGLHNSKLALTSFLNHRSDWWAFTGDETDTASYASNILQQQLEIQPDENPLEDLFSADTMTLLNEFHVLLCKHDTKSNQECSNAIYIAIDENIELTNRYGNFMSAFFTQAGSPRSRKESKAQNKSMGEDGQIRFLELNEILVATLSKTRSKLNARRVFDICSAWYVAGQNYLHQFQKLKKEQRLLDFTDLEWETYLLLNKSNNALWIQYKLDQRIDHLLVDEFQDTNPTQWRLILPLLQEIAASEDNRKRSVFIVGDEKQSIYRFRRAEPRLFIAAEKWLKENLSASTCSLSHSWRSSPAIINFVNNLFGQPQFNSLLPGFVPHDTHRKNLWGKVTLLPLSVKETIDIDNDAIILRNPLEQPRQESVSQHYFNEGLMIAAEIKRLINEKTPVADKDTTRNINYNDIIILLRNRSHVADYERALRQNGIPFIGAKRGTLLESLEVIDMLDLLQWLILPFDNLSLAGILRSPLFSISNEDLIAIKQSAKGSWLERLENFVQQNPQHESLKRAYTLLIQWQDDASKLPVHDLLDKIYSEANVLARYIAAFPQHLSLSVAANLNRFLELALEMDSGRYPSLSRFSAWLNELRQMDNEAPDEPVTSASQENEQRVRILSVHAAKGLEAPVVFLADCASAPVNNKAYSTLIDWPAEKEKPDYFLLTSTKNELDDFSKQCIEQQAFFASREDANLLYVALTRAKQLLFISASEPKNTDQGWFEKISRAYDFPHKESNEAVVLEEHGKPGQADSLKNYTETSPIKTADELQKPLHIENKNIIISPSQQTSLHDTNDEAAAENTIRGIIMHQMLNLLTQKSNATINSFNSSDAVNIEKQILEKWWQECYSLQQSPELNIYFNPENYDKFYNEVPVQFQDNDQMVYGIIDRLLIKDSHVTIIDYKTHPYVTKESMQHIANTYKPQMQLYHKGVKLLWPKSSVSSVLIFTALADKIIYTDL